MDISAVSNVPDIIKKSKPEIVSDNLPAGSQPGQPSQSLPEYEKTIEFSSEIINQAIAQANKSLAAVSTTLSFAIHDKTKEIMVKVVNTNTGEIIREIPPEKLMDRFAEVLTSIGWLVDEKYRELKIV